LIVAARHPAVVSDRDPWLERRQSRVVVQQLATPRAVLPRAFKETRAFDRSSDVNDRVMLNWLAYSERGRVPSPSRLADCYARDHRRRFRADVPRDRG